MRILFVSEGALGVGTVGHARFEPAVRAGLAGLEGVEARFVTLPPLRLWQRGLVHGVPLVNHFDVDLQPLRWHAVQALRTRRLVERELRAFPADAMHVVSHSIAIGLGSVMERVPTFLSVDVGMWAWRAFAQWTPLWPWSRAAMAPSLALERRALRRAAGVLAWSRWACDGLGVDCEIHHPGIDTERLRPAPHEPRERPRVLFIGGRFSTKGGPELLAAMDLVGPDRFDLDVVTFEDVPPRPGMRVLRDLPHEEIVRLQQQADVVVLPTTSDASPWAVLEAMACGAAVISTTVGGIPEMVGDTGVLVPPGDARALAAALRDIDGARLGPLARARVEERYDARKQARRLLELMRSATR